MNQTVENLLDAARQLPLDARRRLAKQLLQEADHPASAITAEQAASLQIVEELYGTITGLDRETLTWIAEDEELCGY
ncbi:MAG: hypothetical protein ACREEM_49405 [Blastocatellia bacterium]